MQLKENTLFAGRYHLIRLCGQGGFSEVWQARDDRTGVNVALKIYAPGRGLDEDGVQLFSEEFALVFNLNHTNLLRPSHYDVCDRMPYLIMPFCERGSGKKLVGKIDEAGAWRFLHDVATGLAYLHAQEPPVIHQDIKPDNVLVDSKGTYLITDFGISTKARSTLRKSVGHASGGGTLDYMGPERFSKHNAPVKASDIWALGATLFELLTGDTPFGEHGGLLLKGGAEIPDIQGAWSDNLKEIVHSCLQKEPWERPTAEQLVEWTGQHVRGKEIPVDRLTRKRVEVEAKREVNIEMVLVQGGTFMMGCTPEQGSDCYNDEKPAHQVTVSSFYIGNYEVTQAQWKIVMGNNPSKFTGDNLPVENVSWDDVQEFLRKLNARTGLRYRLPTEAEWEYAARGGNRSRGYKYSGSNSIGEVAWYNGNSGNKTHPVGQKQPNELGIHDMSGNVYEWCNDWFGTYSSSAQTKPAGPSSGSGRVLRGGSWSNLARGARVPFRNNGTPGYRFSILGFRLARSSN